MTTPLVSIHGGHSGQFCSHAQDTLEAVIQAYIAKSFAWVGLTEHQPPADERFMYMEEREAGFTIEALMERFDRYMTEARRLQMRYAGQVEILVGFETEAYSGAFELAKELMARYQPDYVVGGVHHVEDICFDAGADDYRKAVAACGDIESLYCRYFDLQYDMMRTVEPQVVAHIDLIRIFDADYPLRWRQPAILRRLERNLKYMADRKMILDYNVAALRKGADEPYVSKPILEMARDMEISLVPGDDSHGVGTAGAFIEQGIAVLQDSGVDTQWRKPFPIKYFSIEKL